MYKPLNIAIKLIIEHPKEFTTFLTHTTTNKFDKSTSFGASIFTDHSSINGLGSYFKSGSEVLIVRDDHGNELKFSPKTLRPNITDSIPQINNVDLTFMDNTVKSITASLRSRIKSLKQNTNEIAKKKYEEGYNAGINVLTSLPEGWSVINIPGKLDKYFTWHGILHPHYISNGRKTYKLPEEISNLLFITDIAVPIGEKLYNVLGKGLYPHILCAAQINHTPNTNINWGSTCYGIS